jgi:NADH:ubiquinone oxidoreductase subunit 3 (subunit A)
MIRSVITLALMTIFLTITEKTRGKKDKKTSFECGFESLSEKKITFSTNFIMLIIIFLIFDVEISVLIPFLLINKNNQRHVILISRVFIVALSLLTLKEWKQGSLE